MHTPTLSPGAACCRPRNTQHKQIFRCNATEWLPTAPSVVFSTRRDDVRVEELVALLRDALGGTCWLLLSGQL